MNRTFYFLMLLSLLLGCGGRGEKGINLDKERPSIQKPEEKDKAPK